MKKEDSQRKFSKLESVCLWLLIPVVVPMYMFFMAIDGLRKEEKKR